MNILCDMEYPIDIQEIKGWGKVFVSLNHNFLMIKRKEKAILDAFYEKKPDVFISHIDLIDRATLKAFDKYKDCIKIIFVKKENFNNLSNFKNINFISYSNINNILQIEESCDIFNFLKPNMVNSLISDISYVGNYEKETILNKICNIFDVKIFSETKWPCSNHIGFVRDEYVKNIIFSSKLSIYLDDLKNKKWALNSYLCGRPVLNFKSDWLKNILKNNCFYFDDEKKLINQIHDILTDNIKTKEIVETNKNFVLNNHLSHHRISSILEYCGLKEESNKCLIAAQKIVKNL